MQAKVNEATINRPKGDRVLDNSYVFADLSPFVKQVKEEKAWAKSDRNAITIFKSYALTVTLVALKAGAEFVDNEVDGFFSVQLMDGHGEIKTQEGNIAARPNSMVIFHPGIQNSFRAISDCVLMISTYNTNSI